MAKKIKIPVKELIDYYLSKDNTNEYLGKPVTQAPIPELGGPQVEKNEWSDYDKGSYFNENLEERRSRNQDGWDALGIGTARLLGQGITKTAGGVGMLAGLVGIDNHRKDYKNEDSDFLQSTAAWIAGAADNGLAVVANELEKNLIDATPLYNSTADKEANKASMFHNLTDGDFWAGDGVDAAAFLLSAYLTGGATIEANIGVKVASTLAKGKIFGSNIDKIAKLTNQATATALQTASESMFEAKDVRDSLREQKSQDKYGIPFSSLNPQQQKEINVEVAPAAAKTFALNTAALIVPNFFEMGQLMKKAGRTVSKVEGLAAEGLSTVEKEIGNKVLWNSLPLGKVGKAINKFSNTKFGAVTNNVLASMAREGLYEENIQTAISNLMENDPDASITDIGKIAKGMYNNLSSEEGKKSILLGSLIGGLAGGASGVVEYSRNEERKKNAIKASAISGYNLFKANNPYETEDYEEVVDGKPVKKTRYKLDDKGQPIIDQNKINAIVANKDHLEYLDDIATLAEEKGNDVLANIAKSHSMAKWVKSHFDTGTEDLLQDKIDYLKGLSDQELLEQGIDPTKKDEYINRLETKTKEFTALANQIGGSLLSKDNSKEGAKKFNSRKSELYNIGVTLSSVREEKARLEEEKVKLMSSPESTILAEKQLAYIDLKINELAEVENKFNDEFKKIADFKNGQNYFNNDYKKSIVEKVNDIDHSTVTLDEFNAYENSKLYKAELGLKAGNIESDFFEKGIDERLQTEPVENILDDLESLDASVTQATKDKLQSIEENKKQQLDELESAIIDIQNGEEPSASPETIVEADSFFDENGDLNPDKLDELQNSQKINASNLNKISNLSLKEKQEVSKKTTKEKILEKFTKTIKGVIFNAGNNDDYDNVKEIETSISKLKNFIKVLTEKGDEDYKDAIDTYKNDLIQLEDLLVKVKERLNDKAIQQEKFAEENLNNMISSFGINEEGAIINKEIYDIIKDIVGEEALNLKEKFKDLSLWGKIGYLTQIQDIIKSKITEEQLKQLQDIQKGLSNQVVFEIKEYVKETGQLSDVLINLINKFYYSNPKLLFIDIIRLIQKYSTDKNNAFNIYFKDLNFNNLYNKLLTTNVEVKGSIDKAKSIFGLHSQVLNLSNLITYIDSKYNSVTEIVTENAINTEKDVTTPSNQQLFAIRDLVKFFFGKLNNTGFGNFAYLKGYAGTGKTNIVLKWFCKLSGLKQNEIFAVGHNQYSSEAINKSIGSAKVNTIETLLEGLNTNSLNDVKVLIIDEVNGLSKKELLDLTNAVINYNNLNKTSIKIIGLGDPNQITVTESFAPLEELYATPEISNMTMITPLTVRYRSNVQAVVDAQDIFMDNSKDMVKEGIYLFTNSDNSLGASGNIASDSIEKILKTKDINDGKTRAVIVHPSDVEEWKNKNLGIEVVSYVDVQGRTIDEVYVAINNNRFDNPLAFNKAMYTATSRATNFIFIQGIPSTVVIDDNINNNAKKNSAQLAEAKKEFATNRKDEGEQLDTEIKIVPPPIVPTPPEPNPEEDEEIIDDQDEEEEEEDEEPEPSGPSPINPNAINLKYPTNEALSGNVYEGIKPVEAGESIVFIPIKNKQGFSSIGVFVDRGNGNFIQVALLSQEELNNPPVDKIDIYNKFKESLNKNYTEFITKNGYLNVAPGSSLNILAQGKLENVSKLKYYYKKIGETFDWKTLFAKFKEGFFNTSESANSKIQNSKIRVFTLAEIRALNGPKLKPGRPYAVITSPTQQGGVVNNDQYIELERKKLNKDTHNFMIAPLLNFLDKYAQFKSQFPELTTNDIADLIEAKEDYVGTLLSKLNSKYQTSYILTNEQKQLKKEIDELLFKPLEESDLEFKKKMKVKNLVSPFMITDSNGKQKEINGTIVKVNDKTVEVKVEDKIIEVNKEDLQPVIKRKSGKAQNIFNLIAQGNRTSSGYIIRTTYVDNGIQKSRGKSLLPRTEDEDPNILLEKFNSFDVKKQSKILAKFKEAYNKDFDPNNFTKQDIINLLKFVNYSMSYNELLTILKIKPNGDISDLRVPIPIHSKIADEVSTKEFDYSENYKSTDLDKLLFEDKLEKITPTSISVSIDEEVKSSNVQPIPSSSLRNRKNVKPTTRLLLKSNTSKLGNKLKSLDLLSYLQSIDKTLTAEEVKFVTEAELLKLTEGREAWGLFRDGIIYLSEDNFEAFENVGRHELFHRIFNMMLTPSQQKLVYNKAIEEFNLPSNTPLIDIEELLARKYQEWREGSKINSFFTILFNKIKKFLGMAVNIVPDINTFFTNIEQGQFNEIIDNVDGTSRSYNDIKKDFKTAINFRRAEKYIIDSLNNLQLEYQDLSEVEQGYVPETLEDTFKQIYTFAIEDLNELLTKPDLTVEEKEDLEFLSIIKNPRIYENLIKDLFEGFNPNINKRNKSTNTLTTDNQEIISSESWGNEIDDGELKDHQAKLALKVKQFLSTIINSKTNSQVSPGYVYTVCLKLLTNIPVENKEKFLKILNDRLKVDYSESNSNIKAIMERIQNLATWSYMTTYLNETIPTNTVFDTFNTFDNNGEIIKREKDETNFNFFRRISDKSGINLKMLSVLYLKYDAQQGLIALTVQAGSLYEQNVFFGENGYSDNEYFQAFKNAVRDNEVVNSKNNIISALSKILVSTNVPQLIKDINKIKKGTEEEKRNFIIENLQKTFNILLTSDVKLDTSNTLEDMLIALNHWNTVKANDKAEYFEREALDHISGAITRLAKLELTGETSNRAGSYRRTDGKTAYLHTLASNAINILQSFINEKLFPKNNLYSNNPLYKLNIFQTGLNKIYNYVNFDGIVDEDRNKEPVRYKNETEQDWVNRNFKYFFLSHTKQTSGRYVQQFLTISNKPNIIGAEVNFLQWDKIQESIESILKQQSLRNFKGVKYRQNLNVFDSILKRDSKLSDAQYASAIIKAIKEKDLTSLINTENYIALSNLNSAVKKYEGNIGMMAETNSVEELKDITKNNLLALYYANFFVNSNQLNQLVAGDESFYKNSFDVIKRMSIVFANGYKGFVENNFGLPKEYRTLVAKDIEGMLGEDYVKFLKIYGSKYELTDAQGYMTPKRAAQIRKAYGESLKLGNILKPVHFEIDDNGIPRAIKYSCVELTDELCKMFPKLAQVRQMLENNDIDEMVFKSAVKVGLPLELTVPNEDGSLPTINPNSILTLQNSSYRIQSNPEHDVDSDEVAYPTQLGYFANFSGANTEVANEMFNAMTKLMNNGLYELLGKLGLRKRFLDDDSIKLTLERARDSVRKFLVKKEVDKQSERQNAFLNNPKLGINTPFLVKKAITELAAGFSKATVGIKLPGSGLVLQSAYGTATYIDSNGKEVTSELKWRDKDGCAEVVLPDMWKGKFKIGDNILFDTMVGFRIPATELHSAVPLKVVGFYPNNKNVIIAPAQIVYFHGSDYDVDKLYVMRREISNNTVKLSNGTILHKEGDVVGYKGNEKNKDFEQDLMQLLAETQIKLVEAKLTKDSNLKTLVSVYKALIELQNTYYKNIIVDSFFSITTNKVNEELMMSPISMERFKGMGKETETAFDLVARLNGFTLEKPKRSDFDTNEQFEIEQNKWIDERNKVIFKERNLYDLEDQMLMHKDNFSGTKLTGSFADMAKAIAYFFQSTTDSKYPKLEKENHITINNTTYDGLDYYENSEPIIVNYDKDGNPVYSKPLITETIDSLVNAAIDNVKEQILSIIGFTNNTGNIAISLISMGIPLNDVVRIMSSPVVKNINTANGFKKGYDLTLSQINDKLATLLNLTDYSQVSEETKTAMLEEVDKISITSDMLEKNINKNIQDMTKQELLEQKAILLKVLAKGNTIASTLGDGVKAFEVLKGFDITLHEMQNVLDSFDNMWEDQNNIKNPKFIFENVNPIKLPHINKAFFILKTLKSNIERLFFVENKALQTLSFKVLGTSGVKVWDRAEGETSLKIRENFIHYFMTGLKYTTPEGYEINHDMTNEEMYETANKEYVGTEAWNKRFVDEVLKLKLENPSNLFLKKLSVNKYGQLVFPSLKNIKQADMLAYQSDFEKLAVNGVFTKLQYDFVKYAVLNQGLSFGASNFSLILPDKIYEPLMEEFNKSLTELTANSDSFEKKLSQVLSNFTVQYLLNNGDRILTKVKFKETTPGVNGNIFVPKDSLKEPVLYLKVGSKMYYNVGEEATNWKYAEIGYFSRYTQYQFKDKLFNENYSLNKAFDSSIITLKVKNNKPKNNIFENPNQFVKGQKIRLVNYSDISRLNMIEYTIEEVTKRGDKYSYKLSDSQEVSTILTDSEIMESKEFKQLVVDGMLPEIALHKIKNNC